MFLSKLYDWLKNKNEDLAVGLAFGLAFGLVYGSAFGLVSSLVYGSAVGLAVGLAFGLVYGLAFGLAFGLASGLASGLAFGLFNGEYGLVALPIVIGLIIVSEIIFHIEARKSKTKYDLWTTIKKKAEALFETSLIGINLLNIRWGIQQLYLNWAKTYPILKSIFGWVGLIALIIGGIYLFLKLNQWIANAGKKR